VLAAACATAQTSTASTAPPHLISVVIENQRIEPAAIQVAAGRVILIVHNHSARRQVAPSLLSPSALSVKAFSLPAPNSKDLMDVTLSPGIYVLSEPGIPGTCRITVK
jgi:iron uptake system EfeUOB component EfeO/EfeM